MSKFKHHGFLFHFEEQKKEFWEVLQDFSAEAFSNNQLQSENKRSIEYEVYWIAMNMKWWIIVEISKIGSNLVVENICLSITSHFLDIS